MLDVHADAIYHRCAYCIILFMSVEVCRPLSLRTLPENELVEA